GSLRKVKSSTGKKKDMLLLQEMVDKRIDLWKMSSVGGVLQGNALLPKPV
ncbi:hypothetical protein M404DRAFT_1005555, partial [Pisolithus tinctorius Marx 270]